jgi:hypothetical protein
MEIQGKPQSNYPMSRPRFETEYLHNTTLQRYQYSSQLWIIETNVHGLRSWTSGLWHKMTF